MTAPQEFRETLALAIGSEYEILEELGRGGSSVVYHARDRVLEREVAIKVIRDTQLGDPEAVTRFEREARVLARLQHPNIVMLYAAKPLPGGSLALVMQHSSGRTLKALVRDRGPLPAETAEHILRDLTGALAYLHRNRIVHRDIKPENIFVETETGRALLADFGIAKPGDAQASVTLTGVVIGTPAYMSPEQIDGAGVTGQSDLYSLGMVGYEMLTGRRPWEGESLYSVIFRQKTERLPSLEGLRPDVSERLRLAVERATEKDPAHRWPDAEALLTHLTGFEAPLLPAAELPVPDSPAQLPVEESPTLDVTRILAEAGLADEAIAAAGSPRVRRWHRVGIAAALVLLLGAGAGAVAMTIRPEREGLPLARTATRKSAFAPGGTTTALRTTLPDSPVAAPADAPEIAGEAPRVSAVAAAVAPEAAQATSAPAAPPAEKPVETPAQAPAESPAPPALSEREVTEPVPEPAAPRLSVAMAANKAPSSIPTPKRPTNAAKPQLQNGEEVVRRLQEIYSSRKQTHQGSRQVVILALVDERGSVLDSRIGTPSGLPELDRIAVRASRSMRFSASPDSSAPMKVWVSVPLLFNP